MNPRLLFWLSYLIAVGSVLAFAFGAPWPALMLGLAAGLCFILMLSAAFEP